MRARDSVAAATRSGSMLGRYSAGCSKGQTAVETGGADPKLSRPTSSVPKSEHALELLTSKQFCDLPPSQLVPTLADMDIYVASESTMHRLLAEERLAAHRGRVKPRTRQRPNEYKATGPNQVWCWDITYLRSPVRGAFFYLYLFLDVWSRKIVGWRVYDRECNELAAAAFRRVCDDEGVNPEGLVLHSDNGGPMKGATMAATLEALGVTQSLSRPRVSDDNPFVEALFRTVKYRPNFPDKPFENIEAAHAWLAGFVVWYNEEHLHSGISFVTPTMRHAGLHDELLTHREQVYAAAKAAHPERWARDTRVWDRHPNVRLNPQLGAN